MDVFVELSNLRIHTLMRDMEAKGEKLNKIEPINSQGEGYIGVRHSFKYEIIEFCWTDSKLRKREIAWISYFRKKYGESSKIQDENYKLLLEIMHDLEKRRNERVSFNEIISILIHEHLSHKRGNP